MPDLTTPFSPEGERVYEQGVKRWEELVYSVDRVWTGCGKGTGVSGDFHTLLEGGLPDLPTPFSHEGSVGRV